MPRRSPRAFVRLHGGPRRTPRAARLLLPTALVGSLLLAACGGGSTSEPAAPEPPEVQNTAEAPTLAGQWPLTGLPATGAAPKRPVLVVKIDNTSSSSPQVGLGKADLVAEELVEGGATRLAVFYYSQLPGRVGPVRSMRATDIGIVQPVDAVLVASGGAPPTVNRMRGAGVRTVTEGGTGYYRDSSRYSPYNLFMDLPRLAKTLKPAKAPQNYFPWGGDDALPKGKPARSIDATFSAGRTTSWQYRNGSYENTNSYAAAGDRFQPETVLVLRVQVGDAGYRDPAGNPVPETRFTGKGEALVFHGGKVVRGTWVKNGLDAAVRLQSKGKDLALPAGKVWMELVPANGGSVSYGK